MIVICEKDNPNKQYEFEDLRKLSLFLERPYGSVYGTLYKIKMGDRKNQLIKNYDGLYYNLVSCPDEDLFRYKMGSRYELYDGDKLLFVSNCIKTIGEGIKDAFDDMEKFEERELTIRIKHISK